MASQTVTLDQLEENIVSNARRNSDYRKRLLDDPKALLESQIGQPLPSGLKVTVLQESPTQTYIVLPYDAPSGELSDEDMENVAGGKAKMKDVTCTSSSSTGLQQTTVIDIETKLA